LIGHSLGGAIAIEYAAKHPNDVDKLVLLNTPIRFLLKPAVHFIFHLPEWQASLVSPFVARGSSVPILRDIYENSLKEWDASLLLQELEAPVLAIQSADRFFDTDPVGLKVSATSSKSEKVDRQIAEFLHG
jgi:pimeloyl-ACP methyl ester carboxylesterase